MSARATILGALTIMIAGGAIAQQRPTAPSPGRLAPAGEEADSGVILMREVFDYQGGGRRDPFVPLLASEELRPVLQELRLTGVLVHPTRPIATMRDKEGTQYRVTTGMTIGRMRVVQIKPRTVVFSIAEYGTDRRDSLVLGDTAQVRP